MPKNQLINNPGAAYTTVTNYVLGVDAAGTELPYGQRTETFVASATITRGQAVMTVGTGAAATSTLRVAPVATAGPGFRFVGVAKEPAAAGDLVEVVTYGYVLADVAAGVAVDAALTFSGTVAGRMAALTVDATAVLGACFGRTLAASGTPPVLSPVFIEHM